MGALNLVKAMERLILLDLSVEKDLMLHGGCNIAELNSFVSTFINLGRNYSHYEYILMFHKNSMNLYDRIQKFKNGEILDADLPTLQGVWNEMQAEEKTSLIISELETLLKDADDSLTKKPQTTSLRLF